MPLIESTDLPVLVSTMSIGSGCDMPRATTGSPMELDKNFAEWVYQGQAAHTLRHAFTQMNDAGIIEESMIDMLGHGHAKKGMTAKYGRTGFHLLRDEIYK